MSEYHPEEPPRLDAWKAVGIVVLALVVVAGAGIELPRLIEGPPKEQKLPDLQAEADLAGNVAEQLKSEYQRQADASTGAQEFVRRRWKLSTPPQFPPEQQRVDSMGDGLYRIEGNAIYFDGGTERALPFICSVAASPEGRLRPLSLRMGGEEFTPEDHAPGASPGTPPAPDPALPAVSPTADPALPVAPPLGR